MGTDKDGSSEMPRTGRSRRKQVSGVSAVLLTLLGVTRLILALTSLHHHPTSVPVNVAYFDCIAQAQAGITDPLGGVPTLAPHPGIPNPDPVAGDLAANDQAQQQLAADQACDKYAH